jgi:hypothetical protein
MANQQALDAFLFFVAVFATVALFYGPWQTLCIDRARQHMFNARNDLFLFAADGGIRFDDPAYTETRREIEKMIQFTHYISWPRILSHYIGLRLSGVIRPPRDPLPPAHQELYATRMRVSFAAILCLMCRSVFLLPVFLALYLLKMLKDSWLLACVYGVIQSDAACFDDAARRHALASKGIKANPPY